MSCLKNNVALRFGHVVSIMVEQILAAPLVVHLLQQATTMMLQLMSMVGHILTSLWS